MKQYLLAAVASILVAPAFAADKPVKRPIYTKAPPIFMWTGFYAGANAGVAWLENNAVNSSSTVLSTLGGFNPNFPAAAATGLTTGIRTSRGDGFIGGAQIGYNYQFGSLVAGLETDIQGLSGRSSGTTTTSVAVLGQSANATLTATRSVDWLGTLRARLGIAARPGFLVYGTGGLAYGGVHADTTIGQTLVGVAGEDVPYGSASGISRIRAGWAAGGGAEWMIGGNWSAKAEYLHYDLGSVSYSAILSNIAGVGIPPPVGTVLYSLGQTSSTSFKGDIVRFGLNYKFGYVPVVSGFSGFSGY